MGCARSRNEAKNEHFFRMCCVVHADRVIIGSPEITKSCANSLILLIFSTGTPSALLQAHLPFQGVPSWQPPSTLFC